MKSATPMRVFLYNYLQPEETGAGGVGIYLRNLSHALAESHHDIILMSSGDRYSLTRRKPRLQFSRDRFDRAIIYNSPVIAPAAYAFAEPDVYAGSSKLDFVPRRLAERYGNIDVFHFHNIEGLTASFFVKLRAQFPLSRILLTAHNYHLVCPRVTLWYQDRLACEDYRNGAACTMCHRLVYDADVIKGAHRLSALKSAVVNHLGPFARLATLIWRSYRRGRELAGKAENLVVAKVAVGGDATTPASASSYVGFRKSNIDLCQNVFDRVLAVSDRTRDVLIGRGVPAEQVAVSYIGTAHKRAYLTSEKLKDIGTALHIGYIGYMTRDKGFQFLLECLQQIPTNLAAGMMVTIAAKNTDREAHQQMKTLGSRFKQFRYFDGYTHATLNQVLEGVNLGLIPVLWEDNLPQTAIELVSRGIPILTSDRGGAQEIAHNPKFTFEAGNHEQMVDRLSHIGQRSVSLGDFWHDGIRIYSMEEHVDELMCHYT